jgi:hypothetical protein
MSADKLMAGIIMNIVAQEERHVVREAALSGRDLAADATLDWVYETTLDNVIKRFPQEVRALMRNMLTGGEGLRDAFKKDLERSAGAAWVKR